jgi:uncharacterized membrane protein
MDYKALISSILVFIAFAAFVILGVYTINSENETIRGIAATIFVSIMVAASISSLYLSFLPHEDE